MIVRNNGNVWNFMRYVSSWTRRVCIKQRKTRFRIISLSKTAPWSQSYMFLVTRGKSSGLAKYEYCSHKYWVSNYKHVTTDHLYWSNKLNYGHLVRQCLSVCLSVPPSIAFVCLSICPSLCVTFNMELKKHTKLTILQYIGASIKGDYLLNQTTALSAIIHFFMIFKACWHYEIQGLLTLWEYGCFFIL